MARGGGLVDPDLDEGEQNIDFPMAIRPNQFLLVEKLKPKFEAIDRCLDTLFKRMNDNRNIFENPAPKPVIPNSDSQVIYKQVSDVL